jgi:tetratricopeptide (TPR) repeat protein
MNQAVVYRIASAGQPAAARYVRVMCNHKVRGNFLYKCKRYKLAETEFRLALAEDPFDGYAHASLAAIFNAQGRFKEALAEAKLAVGANLKDAYNRYIAAYSAFNLSDRRQAANWIKEALALSPEPDYFAFAAHVANESKLWREALNLAEAGLAIDPLHAGCIKMSARALTGLDNLEEAKRRVYLGLELNPMDAEFHEQRSFICLVEFQFDAMREHLKEMMHNDPEGNCGLSYIVHALDRQNAVYRLLCALARSPAEVRRYLSWLPQVGLIEESMRLICYVFFAVVVAMKILSSKSGRELLIDRLVSSSRRYVAEH